MCKFKHLKILIVDDSISNQELLRDILEKESLNSSSVSSAKEALEILEKEHFDLILLDVIMPEIDGFTLCDKLKCDPKFSEIPIIFLTSKTDSQSVVKGFDAGGIDYIGKPFNEKELIARVKTHLKLISTNRELIKMNQNLQSMVDMELKKVIEQKKMLMQQSKMASMGEMLASISHQWQQPLNSISLLSQSLIEVYMFEGLSEKEIENFNSQIQFNIKFMLNTIDDFKDFFKPDKEKVLFNVVDEIKSAKKIVSPQLKANSIEFIIENSDKDINIYSFKNEFKQVILNILNNAKDSIKTILDDNAKGYRGVIEVLAKRDGDICIISIKDNGIGIKRDFLDKIFEPFFTTKGNSGTGIGLSISKTIIEEHMGGNIYAKNIKTGGSEFVCEVPIN